MDHGPTMRQLVAEIGSTLLRIAVDGPGADQPLTGVAIHDPGTGGEPVHGCVVLGIGVGPGVGPDESLEELRASLHAAGARALAVKGPVPEELAAGPVPIVEVNPNASWLHVAATIRERLLEHSRARLRPPGVTSDLFTMANTISTMLGAPVTIEDSSSAVLAWSPGQRDTDEPRVQAILGRSVERQWLDELQARGVFAELHATTAPVYVDPVAPGMRPRTAIAVRAGAEVLGYVWAVVSAPLSEELARQLEQVAPMVALHLINTRGEGTWARRQRSELAAAVLGGGSAGIDAAAQLRLGTGPLCVLAAAAGPTTAGDRVRGDRVRGDRVRGDQVREDQVRDDATAAIGLRRFDDALALHLAAVHPSAVTVSGSQAVYALLGWPRSAPRQALDSARQLARDFLARSSSARGYVIAVGGPAASLSDVPRARAQADAALRALRHHPTDRTVATLDDVALPVMLLHLADASESLGLPDTTGALRVLVEHDGADGVLARTLAAYLAAAGVAEDAATELRVHVNTLRYRLRRIREISGLDFGNADAMLLAHLQLRLMALRGTVIGGDNKLRPGSSS